VYKVDIEHRAEKDLKKLSARDFWRITSKIKILADNPRPAGCRKITDSKSDWRIRIGDYRVIYEVDDGEGLVKIMKVRHRGSKKTYL